MADVRILAVVMALAASTVVVSAETKPVKPHKAPATAHWMRMSATAYCLHGITDSGARTRPGSVAADPRLIPLNSTIHVRGLKGARNGRYTVLDSGRAIKHREIDVFMPSCAAARRFGRQAVEVRVLTHGSTERHGDAAPERNR